VQRKFAYAKTDYVTCNEQKGATLQVTSPQHTKEQESASPETFRWLLTSCAFVYIQVSSNRPPSVRFGSSVATQPRNCLGRVATTHTTTTGQPLLTHNPLHTSAVTHFKMDATSQSADRTRGSQGTRTRMQPSTKLEW